MNILITLVLLVVATLLMSYFRGDSDTPAPAPTRPAPAPKPKPDPTPQPDQDKSPTDTKSEPETPGATDDKDEQKEATEPEKAGPAEKKEPVATQVEPAKTAKKAPNKYNKIIIYGPNDSHKTKIFYSLLLQKSPDNFKTETSVEPNISETFSFNGKVTPLVDVPGHSNFESKIGKFIEKNSLLLFVLRTGSQQHNYLGKSAHKLYEVLIGQDLEALGVSIKLAIVKDEGFGGPEDEAEFIHEFEKEIERIKFSRRTHVNADEDVSAQGDYLKNIRENFAIRHIRAGDCSCFFVDLAQDSLLDKI